MPRTFDDDEGEFYDGLDESNDFDEDDRDEFSGESAEIPCQHCGEEMYEDSERCPHCGQYISDEDAPPARKPWWVVVGVIVCLYVMYRWITFK